jgi:AcrR family transcriptional regulator
MAKAGVDKQKILNAAIELIENFGLESLTLKTIAEKLGVRIPSLYNHVNGIDGLLHELSLHGLRLLREVMAEAAIGKSGDDAIISVCNAYFELAKAHPGVYQSIQWYNKNKDKETEEALASIKTLITKILNIEPTQEAKAAHVLRIFRSMVHGFALLESNDGFGHLDSVKASFNYGIQLLIDGMKNTNITINWD